MLIGGLWDSWCHHMRLSGSLLDIPTNNAKEDFSCFPQWSVVVFTFIKETHMEIITENWNSPKCRVAEPSTNRSTVSLLHLRLRDHCEMGREECKSQRIRVYCEIGSPTRSEEATSMKSYQRDFLNTIKVTWTRETSIDLLMWLRKSSWGLTLDKEL